jgi:hypothetical protein
MQPPSRYSVSPLPSFATEVRRFAPPPARSFRDQLHDILTMLGLARAPRSTQREQAIEAKVIDMITEELEEAEAEGDVSAGIGHAAVIAPAGKPRP